MQKYVIIILLLIIIGLIATNWFHNRSYDKLVDKIDNIEKQIDVLSNKKDSIRLVIDTIDNEIVYNNNYYEEVTNTIMSQPSDSDAAFIRYYICRFAESRGLDLR